MASVNHPSSYKGGRDHLQSSEFKEASASLDAAIAARLAAGRQSIKISVAKAAPQALPEGYVFCEALGGMPVPSPTAFIQDHVMMNSY